MGLRDLARRLAADRSGAAAMEFAFVLPVLGVLLIGSISAANLAGAVNGMHYAVEEAARCSAVKTTVCDSAAATVSYARSKYRGLGATPVFVSTAEGCGHTVKATATYQLNILFTELPVPLSAQACYPGAG